MFIVYTKARMNQDGQMATPQFTFRQLNYFLKHQKVCSIYLRWSPQKCKTKYSTTDSTIAVILWLV